MKARFGKDQLHILFTLSLVLLQGCFPDSLTKWREEAPASSTSSSSTVTGTNGDVEVAEPYTDEAPTNILYDSTTVSVAIGTSVSEQINISEEPVLVDGNSYVFSSYDLNTSSPYPGTTITDGTCPTTLTSKSLSDVGLELDEDTGAITGTPTTFSDGSTDIFVIKAYHIPSGTELCTSITFKIANNITDFYLTQDVGMNIVLEVDDSSLFTNGDYVSNSEGTLGQVTGGDTTSNRIYLTISSGSTYAFKTGQEIDDSSTFVTKAATISKVIYALTAGTAFPASPAFEPVISPSLSTTEGLSLTWNASPDAITNIPTGTDPIVFDSSTGTFTIDTTNGGTQLSPQDETLYTVTVRNIIGNEVSESIYISSSYEPRALGAVSRVLLRLSDNTYFKVGRYISSASGAKGRVIEKDAIASENLLSVEMIEGEFVDGDSVDIGETYSTEVATIYDPSEDLGETVEGVLPFTFRTSFASATNVEAGNYVYLDDPAGGEVENIGVIEYASGVNAYIRLAKGTFSSSTTVFIADASDENIEASGGPTSLGSKTISQLNEAHMLKIDVELGTDTSDKVWWEKGISISTGSGTGAGATLGAAGVVEGIVSGNSGDVFYVQNLGRESFNGSGYQVANANPYNRPFQVTGIYYATNTESVIHKVGGDDAPGFKHGDQLDAGEDIMIHLPDSTGAFQDCDDVTLGSGNSGDIGCAGAFTEDFSSVKVLVDQEEQKGGDTVTTNYIEGIDIDYSFTFYRGEDVWIKPSLSSGENVKYTISPDDLSDNGLSLDPDTGIISGVPTTAMARTDYALTASNAIGYATTNFSIKINDHITLRNKKTDVASYLLHKSGQGQEISKCRLTKDQINGTAEGEKTIECFLEAGELDLYQEGLELELDVGKGICEFVTYSPYHFWQYPYIKTSKTVYVHNVADDCTTCDGQSCDRLLPSTTDSALFCSSDYSTYDASFPNCDDGTVTIVEYTWTDSDANNDCTPATATEVEYASSTDYDCGGSSYNCVAGPLREVINQTDFENGKASLSYNALAGLTNTYTITAPLNNGYSTNMSIANYMESNLSVYENGYVSGTIAERNQNAYFRDIVSWVSHSPSSSSDLPGNMFRTDPFVDALNTYIFSCLDSAYDVKGRILLTVRDWNRNYSAANYVELLYPDHTTISSTQNLMDNTDTDFFNVSYNDVMDWDDLIDRNVSEASASLTSVTTGASQPFGVNAATGLNSSSYYLNFANPDDTTNGVDHGSGEGNGYFFDSQTLLSTENTINFVRDTATATPNIDETTFFASTKVTKGSVFVVDHLNPENLEAGETEFFTVYFTRNIDDGGLGDPDFGSINVITLKPNNALHITNTVDDSCGSADGTNVTSPAPTGSGYPDCSSEILFPNSIPFPLDDL